MTISAVLERPYISPRALLRNGPNRSLKFRAAILRGIRDSQMGRVRPWSEVKKEFGL